MDIATYEKATMLLDRYTLCGDVLEWLSDSSKTRGHKFKELMNEFAKEFNDELLVFVHDLQTNAGMEFENLHCECRPEDDDENSTEQENPKS